MAAIANPIKSVNFFAAFFVAFLLIAASPGMMMMVEGLCEKASQTWSGNCGVTSHCDNQCKTWEDARHGACHQRGGHSKCFCYFNKCKK